MFYRNSVLRTFQDLNGIFQSVTTRNDVKVDSTYILIILMANWVSGIELHISKFPLNISTHATEKTLT